MKKMINDVKLVGYVYDFNLSVKTVQNEASKNYGKSYINGTLDIQTDENGLNVVTVHFAFVQPVYNSGKPNATYGVLEQIINNSKTVLNDGKENATKVSVNGSIELNDFYTDRNVTEELVSAKRIAGSFVNIVKEIESVALPLDVDFILTGAKRVEETENDCEHLILKGNAFNFRNAILPMEFRVEAPVAMDYFEGLEPSPSNPTFTRLKGEIINQSIVKEVEIESAFGEPIINKITRNVKKWLIKWAARVPYEFDDESTITVAEINKAIADREVYLADVKKRADEYKAKSANNNSAFNTSAMQSINVAPFSNF